MLPDLAAATSLKSLSYMIIIFRHVAKQKIYANTGPPIETTWPCRPRTTGVDEKSVHMTLLALIKWEQKYIL